MYKCWLFDAIAIKSIKRVYCHNLKYENKSASMGRYKKNDEMKSVEMSHDTERKTDSIDL